MRRVGAALNVTGWKSNTPPTPCRSGSTSIFLVLMSTPRSLPWSTPIRASDCTCSSHSIARAPRPGSTAPGRSLRRLGPANCSRD
jgi:hypothetical protein